MELNVKAVSPSAHGWRTYEDQEYVTDWSVNILLWDDPWEVVSSEPKAYFRAPTESSTVLYMSQDVDSGYSSFYADDPNNHQGFGGRDVKLPMYDGSVTTLKGPWSSNSAVMNEHIAAEKFEDDPHFEFVKEVTFWGKDWRTVGFAASLGVTPLKFIVQEFLGQQWHLAWGELGGSERYVSLHAPEAFKCPGERIT